MFFFSSLKLQYRRTIVLLNKLKLFKETSFSKARMVMRFPAKKNPVAQKHHAISRQERWHFPLPVGLLWDFPPPPRESVRVYTDVTTKIFQIDRLPNFLSNGAPLAGFARRLRYKPAGNGSKTWARFVNRDNSRTFSVSSMLCDLSWTLFSKFRVSV